MSVSCLVRVWVRVLVRFAFGFVFGSDPFRFCFAFGFVTGFASGSYLVCVWFVFGRIWFVFDLCLKSCFVFEFVFGIRVWV